MAQSRQEGFSTPWSLKLPVSPNLKEDETVVAPNVNKKGPQLQKMEGLYMPEVFSVLLSMVFDEQGNQT